MSSVFVFLLLAVVFHTIAASSVLPDQFYGKFDLDHSDNFEEYLTAKGYNFFIRKIAAYASVQKVFARSSDANLFDFATLTSQKDVRYKSVALGKSFKGEALDSTMHEITFTLSNGHLLEHHKPLEGGQFKEETYEYYFQGNFMIMRLSYQGVEALRYFKISA